MIERVHFLVGLSSAGSFIIAASISIMEMAFSLLFA